MKLVRETILVCLYLTFSSASDDSCDKSKCPGPLAYYADLKCTPVYKNEDDCCAYKYNCDHLENRSVNKCYVNGKEYEIGEALREEDANPCDIGCTCRESLGVAAFSCAIVDCFHGPTKPGCYMKHSPLSCCPGPEVCPENPEDRATCVVDGKTYKDGEYFPQSDPNKTCYCAPGYKGENVEPFCSIPKRGYCSTEFRNAYYIENKCAPTYYSSQSPQTDCSVASRCQNDKDEVIKTGRNGDPETSDDVCRYGNLTLHLGDELNQATDYSSVCIKCVCEVPPIPTCQRLPDEECDVTSHPPFDHN